MECLETVTALAPPPETIGRREAVPMTRRGAASRAIAFLLTVGAVIAALAVPAFAHADLVSTDPGAGATVSDSPASVTLTFTEGVDVRKDSIRLLDGAGDDIAIGAPEHPDGQDNVIAVTVPALDKGLYTVAYNTVSADAHPVNGAFTFGVQVAATGEAAAAQTEKANAAVKDDRLVGWLHATMRFGVFAGLALVLGAAWFCAALWPEGRTARSARRVLGFAFGITAVATAFGFLLQGSHASGGSLGDAFSGDSISAVWDSRFGKVWALRLALLVVAAVLVRMMMRHRGRVPNWWFDVGGVVALALAATPGLAGHASTGRWVAVALPADALHVLAMAIWLGGLAMLLVARSDESRFAGVAERFSGAALGAVVVIVLTGTFQAVRQVPTFSDLWDSDYGRILLIKIGIVLGLILLAAWSRQLLHGGMGLGRRRGGGSVPPMTEAIGAGDAVAGAIATPAPMDESPPEERPTPARLVRAVRGELVFGAVVLALTAGLVNTPPPRDTVNAEPVQTVLDAGQVRIDTFFGPAKSGEPNELHITVLNRSGAARDVTEMKAELANPSRGIPAIDVPLDVAGTGHFIGQDISVPFPGTWTLTLTVFVTDVTSETASVDVTVG